VLNLCLIKIKIKAFISFYFISQAVSYLLTSGSAAGFGATRDLKKYPGETYNIGSFFDMGYA
jgi:hypothetical protein